MSDSRPKTKKLRNATPNINLPVINSGSSKFNWKTLSESNVYILKKLPEVSLKESSLNQLDRIEFGDQQKGVARKKKEFIKQNSSTSLGKVKAHANSENLIKHRTPVREHSSGHPRPTTNQKLQVHIKCYLCNQQFNGKEIIKHEADCLERWRQLSSEEKRKAIEEQKQWLNETDSDAAPSSEGDLNSPADTHGQWKKFKAILRSCGKCGRNFFEHRLEKHEANCKGRQAPTSKAENDGDKLADAPDRSASKETLRDRNGQRSENIVFVRKTKPLNSRSTQLYKQQQATNSTGLPFMSSGQSNGDSQSSGRRSPETAGLVQQIDQQSKSREQRSNGEPAEKTNASNSTPKASTTNYFAKCPQCGRVLNKSNFQTHEKYHARSSSLNQSPDDRGAQDSRTDHLSFNGLSLDGSSPLSPVNPVDASADRAIRADAISVIHAIQSEPPTSSDELSRNLNGINEQTKKAELIVQLSKQFNPTNQSNRAASQSNRSGELAYQAASPAGQRSISQRSTSPANQTSPSDQSKAADQHSTTNGSTMSPTVDGQLMFNEDEWSEHLSKLKKCYKCDRTFFANRIKKHQSICKAKKAQPV